MTATSWVPCVSCRRRKRKRLLADEITDEEHFLLWSVLRKRTPPEVHRARLKIERTRAEARRNVPGAAED